MLIDRLATGAEGRNAQKKSDHGDYTQRVATFTVCTLLPLIALVAAISTVLRIFGDIGATLRRRIIDRAGARTALPTWAARVLIARKEARAFAASCPRRAAFATGAVDRGGPTPATATLKALCVAAPFEVGRPTQRAATYFHGIASCRCDEGISRLKVLRAQRRDA